MTLKWNSVGVGGSSKETIHGRVMDILWNYPISNKDYLDYSAITMKLALPWDAEFVGFFCGYD